MLARTMGLIAAALLLLAAQPAASAEQDNKGAQAASSTKPLVFVTRHSGRFNGQTVKYTATAGETYLKDSDGKPTASIFSVAYVRDGVSDPTRRPVVFIFNGGPGSASLWLHMGAFGPRRVDAPPSNAEDDGAPPFPIVDNRASILDIADLVFIDPVGTGFSHALGEKDGKDFWGITEDARSVSQFIRRWITTNKRWNSPKYLAGESYGTFRAAAVTHELEGGLNDVALNGIILISTVLDLTGSDTRPGNEAPYVSFLPTYAATAWYHNKVADRPETVEAFIEEARQFALNDYAVALLKGSRLDGETRAAIIARLARFTGLSETYIDRANLRVSPARFQKELLRDQGKTVGRLDGRFTGIDYDDAGERPDADPSFYAIDGAYTGAVNHYLATELNVEMDRQFEPLSFAVNRGWNWNIDGDRGRPSYINVAPYVGTAMRQNKHFRVLVASGYYDFATPFFGAENSMARNGIMPERVTMTYYPAGHMMYVHAPSLKQLNADVRAFIEAGKR
ncbi:MAG: S10 family peptidase [Sphingomonadales bacterium]